MGASSSLELRWFVPGRLPPLVSQWWAAVGSAEPESRVDRYLLPTPVELSVKQRGVRSKRVEAKELRAPPRAVMVTAGTSGWAQAWDKRRVARSELPPGSWVEVRKVRWQVGELELGEVVVGDRWAWTFAVELRGRRATPSVLAATARAALADCPALSELALARSGSYRDWLSIEHRRSTERAPPQDPDRPPEPFPETGRKR